MDEQETASLYAAAVGRRADFYVPYFQRADSRGYAPKSWNWAAFFLDVFWFLYRRQFRWAAVITLAALLASMLAAQIHVAGFTSLAYVVQFGFLIGFKCIYLPLNANGFYYHWVRQRLEKAQAKAPQDRQRQTEALVSACKPNVHVPLMIFALLVLLSLLTMPLQPSPGS